MLVKWRRLTLPSWSRWTVCSVVVAGWRQAAVVGIPADENQAEVGELDPEDIKPLRFADGTDSRAEHPKRAQTRPNGRYAVRCGS